MCAPSLSLCVCAYVYALKYFALFAGWWRSLFAYFKHKPIGFLFICLTPVGNAGEIWMQACICGRFFACVCVCAGVPVTFIQIESAASDPDQKLLDLLPDLFYVLCVLQIVWLSKFLALLLRFLWTGGWASGVGSTGKHCKLSESLRKKDSATER